LIAAKNPGWPQPMYLEHFFLSYRRSNTERTLRGSGITLFNEFRYEDQVADSAIGLGGAGVPGRA
jgi:hypothetical protein